MDIPPEVTRQYIQELQALRNQRLDFVLSQGVGLEDLIADIMNSLEVFYVIQRFRKEHEDVDTRGNNPESDENT